MKLCKGTISDGFLKNMFIRLHIKAFVRNIEEGMEQCEDQYNNVDSDKLTFEYIEAMLCRYCRAMNEIASEFIEKMKERKITPGDLGIEGYSWDTIGEQLDSYGFKSFCEKDLDLFGIVHPDWFDVIKRRI